MGLRYTLCPNVQLDFLYIPMSKMGRCPSFPISIVKSTCVFRLARPEIPLIYPYHVAR